MHAVLLYLLTVIFLVVFLYFVPALALVPRFAFNPRTAATLPFISILAITITQRLLVASGHFSQQAVLIVIGLFFIIAVVRLLITKKEELNTWKRNHLVILGAIVVTSLPLIVNLGLTGFQFNDEIYSWNYWARQFYLGENIDFSYTRAPYPLLLSAFLSFCYKSLGNLDYQLPIRFTFVLIYISTVFVLSTFAKTKKEIGIFILSFVFLFLLINLVHRYGNVLADPLMSGFLVSAYALLFSTVEYNSKLRTNLIIVSALLVSAATFTKQAAIPWTMIFFPCTAYFFIQKNKTNSKLAQFSLFVPILAPFLWYLLEGRGFTNNESVIKASLGDRGYLEQLVFSTTKYMTEQPFLVVFLVIVFFVLFHKTNIHKKILSFSIFVATLIWLIFGAYSVRLFMHVLLIGWLVILYYGMEIFLKNNLINRAAVFATNKRIITVLGILFVGLTIRTADKRAKDLDNITNILDGGQVQARYLLGKSGAKQYRWIRYGDDGKIWLSTPYLYGVFYGLTDVYRRTNSSKKQIVTSIIKEKIDKLYLLDKKSKVINGSTNHNMRQLIEKDCSRAFTRVDTAENRMKATLYIINREVIEECKI